MIRRGLRKIGATTPSPRDDSASKHQQLVETLVHTVEPSTTLIKHDQVSIGARIAQGGFSTVYQCTLATRDVMLHAAAKVISDDKMGDTKLLISECRIWSGLSHRHIVSLYGICCEREHELVLVCEYFNGGSLYSRHHLLLAEDAAPPTLADLVSQLTQIASAMAFLHSRPLPIVHRDLKSSNILIDETHMGLAPRLAIADFGLARHIPQPHERCMTSETGSCKREGSLYHQTLSSYPALSPLLTTPSLLPLLTVPTYPPSLPPL